MQDRSPPTRRSSLATHGRTIHQGQSEHPPCGIAMSNEMTRRMLQVAVQRAVAQCAIAERAVIGGGPRGGAHARGWAGSGLIVWTGRASAWLHAAAEVVRRGFAAVIW